MTGSIQMANAATQDTELRQLAAEVTNECKDIVDPNRCDLAVKLVNCINDSAMKRGVDPKTFH